MISKAVKNDLKQFKIAEQRNRRAVEPQKSAPTKDLGNRYTSKGFVNVPSGVFRRLALSIGQP